MGSHTIVTTTLNELDTLNAMKARARYTLNATQARARYTHC